MENSINDVSLQELQTNICLEDLNSPDPLARQYAISQLQNFVDSEKVLEALKARQQIEQNPECKNDLDEILKLAIPARSVIEISDNQATKVADLVDLWKSVETAQLFELVKHVKKLDQEDQVKVFCEILSTSTSSAQIVPILSLSRKVMMRDEVIDRLETLVKVESSLLVVRIVSLLTRLKPAKLVPHLPWLLTHKNFQVRLMAIKALHLLSKSEAIRLLNELMFSKNSSSRSSAFSFLFILPFNDTGDIVLRLIESGDLPKNLDQTIRFLIYNNPDQRFFRRITISYLLHGKKLAALKNYWLLAARSLVVSGLVKKSEQDLKAEVLKAGKEFILRHTSHKQDEKKPEKIEDSSVHKNQDLLLLFAVKEFLPEHSKKLLQICNSISLPEDISAAIKLIDNNNLSANPFCNWLENLLEKDSPEIVGSVIDTLLKINKNRLLPHLPILVFHKDSSVSEKSLKVFSSEFSEKLVEKIKLWIRDNNEKIREAAYKGLLEIEFLQARDLIMALVKTTSKLELIKYYSSILLLNPDRVTVYKLSDLAWKSSGEKRKLLMSLADEIKSELGEFANEENTSTLNSIIAESGLREQWDEILTRIKHISYDSQTRNIWDLFRSRTFNMALAGFLILAIFVFLIKFKMGGNIDKQSEPAALEKGVYSYDLGKGQEGIADREAARPWDYQLPKLATPPDSLYEILTVEERRALHEELKSEVGSSAEKIPFDDLKIRLEVESLR
ncbi:MAG: hypothetical protein KKB51_18065 [Candidatus Riflebacteria bacterium]|nr:hypothetical protein [Candidatus Riflebacteria bacterium]